MKNDIVINKEILIDAICGNGFYNHKFIGEMEKRG